MTTNSWKSQTKKVKCLQVIPVVGYFHICLIDSELTTWIPSWDNLYALLKQLENFTTNLLKSFQIWCIDLFRTIGCAWKLISLRDGYLRDLSLYALLEKSAQKVAHHDLWSWNQMIIATKIPPRLTGGRKYDLDRQTSPHKSSWIQISFTFLKTAKTQKRRKTVYCKFSQYSSFLKEMQRFWPAMEHYRCCKGHKPSGSEYIFQFVKESTGYLPTYNGATRLSYNCITGPITIQSNFLLGFRFRAIIRRLAKLRSYHTFDFQSYWF